MTILEAGEPMIARAMSGVMTRDWQKVLDALQIVAESYHAQNGLPLHPGIAGLTSNIKSLEARKIASAAVWAFEREGK